MISFKETSVNKQLYTFDILSQFKLIVLLIQ